MLVLRRKVGERFVLSDTITISILAIQGRRVKVGILAPPEVVVVRQACVPASHGPAESSLPLLHS